MRCRRGRSRSAPPLPGPPLRRRASWGVDKFGHAQRHAVLVQAGTQQATEPVARQAAEKSGRQSQSADGSGGVEGSAPWLRSDAAVVIENEIDQRLTGNGDHLSARAAPVTARARSLMTA